MHTLASAPASATPYRCCREEEDLKGGAVLKGTVQPGEGEERPREGDLVRRLALWGGR